MGRLQKQIVPLPCAPSTRPAVEGDQLGCLESQAVKLHHIRSFHIIYSHIYCIWYNVISFIIVLRSFGIYNFLFAWPVQTHLTRSRLHTFPTADSRNQPKVLRSHRSCVNFKNYWRELAVTRALFHCRLGETATHCESVAVRILEAKSSSFWVYVLFPLFEFLKFNTKMSRWRSTMLPRPWQQKPG